MPRILIADDNSNIQKMVTLALQGAGIDVISVSNGGAAIRTLPDTVPDLVLADIFMPVRSGYEVCDFIKHEPRFSHVPVVLLVGAFDPLDESEAQRVSADGILKKPFIPPDPLINMVKALLAKSLSEQPEAVSRNGIHAAQDQVPEPASRAPEVGAAEFNEELPEEFAPPILAPDFGSHEETLAFGSLLDEKSSVSEIPAESPSARPEPVLREKNAEEELASLRDRVWSNSAEPLQEDEGPESLRSSEEHAFPGAYIPEMDEIGPQPTINENVQASAAGPNESDETFPEIGSELNSEFASGFGTDFDSGQTGSAAQPSEAPLETARLAWESTAALPINLEQSANSELAGEIPAEDTIDKSELDRADLGGGKRACDEAPPVWRGPAVPAFPGSEQLWASPPEIRSGFKDVTQEEAKEEICDASQHVEAAVSPSAFELSAVELPAFEPPAIEEPVANSAPAALVTGVAVPAVELAGEASPDFAPAGTAATELSEPAESSAAVKPAAPDPELIEAVVTRIVERMQPKMIDVVTREILRPLVEALVRREINKSN